MIVLRGGRYMTKLSLYLATLLLGTNFSASTTPRDAGRAIQPIQTSVMEQRLIDLTNAERFRQNLPPLSTNPTLIHAAREHSREMSERNYFDHISPNPEAKTPMRRYLNELGHTPTYACVGENLFYCSIVDVEKAHDCLMASPKHRENILNHEFQETGVGVYVSADGQFYVTQLFLTQVD
jgi:uncharacterized protein YkwD